MSRQNPFKSGSSILRLGVKRIFPSSLSVSHSVTIVEFAGGTSEFLTNMEVAKHWH